MNKRKKINHKIPRKGDKFEKTFKNKIFTLYVKEINNSIKFELDNKIYDTPSGAAFAVTKNYTNGWKFWNIDK
ncbi:MAG: hypothetical protein P4L45_04535 [Ignavibacteriaceae bacterium]|nr:hypothetical protein [Ignavibacteriaceae bacterium]